MQTNKEKIREAIGKRGALPLDAEQLLAMEVLLADAEAKTECPDCGAGLKCAYGCGWPWPTKNPAKVFLGTADIISRDG